MRGKEATRRRGNCNRVFPGSGRTRSIVSDYDTACLAAGLLIAVSFGLMFCIGTWLGW